MGLNQQPVRPSRPNQPPIRPSGQPVRPNQPQIRPNQPPVRPNQPTVRQNQPLVRPKQPPVRPNQPPFRPNQQPPRPDQQKLNPNQENVSSTQQQIDRSDNIDKLFYAESVQNNKFFQRKHQQTHVYKPYNQEYTNKKPTLTTEQPIPIYQTSNPSYNSRPTRIPYAQPTHNHGSHPRYSQKQQQSFFGKISSSASGLWNSLG